MILHCFKTVLRVLKFFIVGSLAKTHQNGSFCLFWYFQKRHIESFHKFVYEERCKFVKEKVGVASNKLYKSDKLSDIAYTLY